MLFIYCLFYLKLNMCFFSFKKCLVFLILVSLIFAIGRLICFREKIFEVDSISKKNSLNLEETKVKKRERTKIKVVPPKIVKGIYLTGWSAANNKKIEEIIKLKKQSKINAVVIDIKDWSGYVFYDAKVKEAKEYKAQRILIKDIEDLLNNLHQQGIYVIGRIVVFQDPVLAKARKDLALKRHSQKDILWRDNLKLSWVDPSSIEVWKYNLKIAKDALEKGFDEINFDYIRFPSDGNLKEIDYPFWDKKKSKQEVIKSFFKYLRENLSTSTLSIDIFGMTTVRNDDLGIGQVLEDAFEYFDYICPMAYPSHFESGFLGYKNPAQHPYQVVKYCMENALKKLIVYSSTSLAVSTSNYSSLSTSSYPTSSCSHILKYTGKKTGEKAKFPKIRPWLQDFDLKAKYNVEMVKAEIKGIKDALGENFSGFLLWNPKNIYTIKSLQ